MTDTELDEMLDLWTAPQVQESWRGPLRAQLVSATPRSRLRQWRMPVRPFAAFAGFAAGAVLCVALIAVAYPQVLPGGSSAQRIPFLAESRFLSYGRNGSPAIDFITLSYQYKGSEVTLQETKPGDPLFLQLARNIRVGVQLLMIRFAPGLALPKGTSDAFVRSGCGSGLNVIGREVILGYSTTVIQTIVRDAGDPARVSWWFAPDLGCFPLKMRWESRQPDGSYQLHRARETVNVTMSCRKRAASGFCIERYSKYPFE